MSTQYHSDQAAHQSAPIQAPSRASEGPDQTHQNPSAEIDGAFPDGRARVVEIGAAWAALFTSIGARDITPISGAMDRLLHAPLDEQEIIVDRARALAAKVSPTAQKLTIYGFLAFSSIILESKSAQDVLQTVQWHAQQAEAKKGETFEEPVTLETHLRNHFSMYLQRWVDAIPADDPSARTKQLVSVLGLLPAGQRWVAIGGLLYVITSTPLLDQTKTLTKLSQYVRSQPEIGREFIAFGLPRLAYIHSFAPLVKVATRACEAMVGLYTTLLSLGAGVHESWGWLLNLIGVSSRVGAPMQSILIESCSYGVMVLGGLGIAAGEYLHRKIRSLLTPELLDSYMRGWTDMGRRVGAQGMEVLRQCSILRLMKLLTATQLDRARLMDGR